MKNKMGFRARVLMRESANKKEKYPWLCPFIFTSFFTHEDLLHVPRRMGRHLHPSSKHSSIKHGAMVTNTDGLRRFYSKANCLIFSLSAWFLAAKAQLNTCTCLCVCPSVRLWSKLNFSLFTPLYM